MINFSEVEKSVNSLKKQLAAGQIDGQTLEKRLLEMIDVAEDGYYWMLGHQTGTWYRHDGEKWVVDNPSESYVSANNIDSLAAQWQSVNILWLVISLIVLAAVGGIVYYVTL